MALPIPRRSRLAWGYALVVHVLLLLTLVSVVRQGERPDDLDLIDPEEAGGGGGGGRAFIVALQAPEPAPTPTERVPPVVRRPTPPVKVPVVAPPILPPIDTPAPVPADTVTRAPADSAGTKGTGGGAQGGAGTGTGPGSGAGTGPGSGTGRGGGPGGTGTGTSRARGPEPRQLILPPFEFPKSMRGMTIQVTFVVESDGRVSDVVFIPEVPDRGYGKQLEKTMKSYLFRPARSDEGLPIKGATVVHITF
jgi:outer membrane biosynthesis protein TonB